MAKKATKTKKELLPAVEDLGKVSLGVSTRFSVVEIKMKNDWRWKIKMLAHKVLPTLYGDYAVKLEFDDEPFLKAIEQYEKEIRELDTNPTLYPDMDKRSLKKLDEKILNTRKEMAKLKAECDDIEFVAQTEGITYSGNDTCFVFKVLDTLIEQLNEKKYKLDKYRAIMEPIAKK